MKRLSNPPGSVADSASNPSILCTPGASSQDAHTLPSCDRFAALFLLSSRFFSARTFPHPGPFGRRRNGPTGKCTPAALLPHRHTHTRTSHWSHRSVAALNCVHRIRRSPEAGSFRRLLLFNMAFPDEDNFAVDGQPALAAAAAGGETQHTHTHARNRPREERTSLSILTFRRASCRNDTTDFPLEVSFIQYVLRCKCF